LRKNFWLSLRLAIVPVVVACVAWFVIESAVASAAHIELPSNAEDTDGSPLVDFIVHRPQLAPLPPLRKAYMGAPMLVFDSDGDTQLLDVDEKWIDVDLSEQKVVAFEGTRPVRSFIVSSGLSGTPTVTGTFRIRAKVRSQTMSGPGYSLPNVEWVQYFYQDYAFHGAYWHNNFGQPMSRGCINMTNDDAKWLFDWAGPTWDGNIWMHVPQGEGTLVVVHE
jgi:lipoprotein-anchoring transpeptidase ErfK/SrfK